MRCTKFAVHVSFCYCLNTFSSCSILNPSFQLGSRGIFSFPNFWSNYQSSCKVSHRPQKIFICKSEFLNYKRAVLNTHVHFCSFLLTKIGRKSTFMLSWPNFRCIFLFILKSDVENIFKVKNAVSSLIFNLKEREINNNTGQWVFRNTILLAGQKLATPTEYPISINIVSKVSCPRRDFLL